MGGYSDDERARRVERARELHRKGTNTSTGRTFGGVQPGAGRPRKVKVTEIINEAATGDAELIIESFRAAMHPKNPAAVRAKAAAEYAKFAERFEHVEREEARRSEGLSPEELKERLTELLLNRGLSGFLPPVVKEQEIEVTVND